ncbi:tyrosine-type recombinase/integrase [Falsiroseomonas sp. HW251]|uniref:tyrosine-type recombinase/integrase n=1 Tax=Falsiroseomonas sp. HW251 TaxID=3390998 RepID=UPI003D32060B
MTDDVVADLRCPEGRKDTLVFCSGMKGFGVRVQSNGVKTFLFRYKLAGISRRMPLGTFGELTTAKARKEAERLRGLVLSGRDPWGERKRDAAATAVAEREARVRSAAAAFTVSALIDLYAEKHVAKLRPATQRDVLSRLRLHLRPIADEPANSIGRAEAARVVDAAAEAGETTARRVRDYARAMWRWARDRGTLPDTNGNPWETAPAPGRDRPRERVLNGDELGQVWRAASTIAAPYGPMVCFTMLTLARREEVAAMTWGEVAPGLTTWTQPGTRTKNGKPHIVHLADPARAILRKLLGAQDGKPLPPLPSPDRHVFGLPGDKAITSHSWVKRQLDAEVAALRAKAAAEAGAPKPEPVPPWVLHDFRRSGVTWLAEAGFPPHVADRLLNHVQGTIKGVAAIYQKGAFLEERARALTAWAAHVEACADARRDQVIAVADLAEQRAKRRA